MADKNESGIFKVAMNLVLTCLVSGCIIGAVFFITGPTATAKAEQMKQDSMKSLVPQAEKFVPVQGEKDTFIAEQGGKKVAYIIPTAPKGYGGPIKMLTAVSMDGKVLDYTVLEANETPGLGDRGAKSPFNDQFKGKKLENLEVTKDHGVKDKIQAMTGATISSRAFTLGVKQAVEKAAQLGGK